MAWQCKLIPTGFPEDLEEELADLMQEGWEVVGSILCMEQLGQGQSATRYTLPHVLLRRQKQAKPKLGRREARP